MMMMRHNKLVETNALPEETQPVMEPAGSEIIIIAASWTCLEGTDIEGILYT